MRFRSSLALGAVAGIVAGTVALGIAAPANASIGDAYSLWQYAITLKGSQLAAAMGPGAMASWGPQFARQAAQSTSTYSLSQVYGLTNDNLGDLVNINGPTKAEQAIGKSSLWNKIKVPKFSNIGLMKPGALGGLGLAVTAYMYRADFANGVTSMLGFGSANDLVCTPGSGFDSGFGNFVTGQDCTDFAQKMEQSQINLDAAGGFSMAPICKTQSGVQHCVTGVSKIGGGPVSYGGNIYNDTWLCMSGTGAFPASPPKGTGVYLVYSQPAYVNRPTGNTTYTEVQGTPVVTPAGMTACDSSGMIAQLEFHVQNPTGTAVTDYLAGLKPLCMNILGAPTCGAGSSAITVTQASNPDRTIRCAITGNNGTVYTADSAPWKETETPAVAVCPTLPPGVDPTHIRYTEEGGGQTHILGEEDASPSSASWQAAYGDHCKTNTCVTDLVDNTKAQSCFNLGDGCNGWFEDPNRSTDYSCTYAGAATDIRDCYMYAHLFDPAKREAGNPYADPQTGDDTGIQTDPRKLADDNTLSNGAAIGPGTSTRSCFGGYWSVTADPLHWVMQPVQCALQWAGVPDPVVVQAAMTNFSTTWGNTTPGKLGTAVSSWHIAPVLGGCRSTINMPITMTHQVIPFDWINTCPGTPIGDNFAPIIRIVVDASFMFAAAYAIKRIIASWVDYS